MWRAAVTLMCCAAATHMWRVRATRSLGCGGHGPVEKGTWQNGGEGGVGMNENLAAGDDDPTRMG